MNKFPAALALLVEHFPTILNLRAELVTLLLPPTHIFSVSKRSEEKNND